MEWWGRCLRLSWRFSSEGDRLMDLLDEERLLRLMEDRFSQVQVQGVKEVEVSNTEEFMEVINTGAQYRMTASTAKNVTSSRSHAICRIRITGNKLARRSLLGGPSGFQNDCTIRCGTANQHVADAAEGMCADPRASSGLCHAHPRAIPRQCCSGTRSRLQAQRRAAWLLWHA
ncbi:hypothetical protein BC936DRAFT_137913 [Jimgerdemannia flammicorona]|uniref:Kinesin motor domain-containing protein n=1 Tax=Jimgerdemannia flammicorona TaxID=994334 RepID=A0A433CWF7_9FUNG|nr:hypothetical protein BC936DRAFT_137913 [Jimgerdemannia flammicorona]